MRHETEEELQDRPGVIAPPLLIFGGVLLAALGLDRLLAGPGFGLPSEARLTAGLLLAIAGAALIIAAAVHFRRAKTHIEPWKPTTAIVTTGVYRVSRNPIYLGLALGYLALSLLADSMIAMVMLPVALAVMHYGVILREEKYLDIKFGEEYRAFKRRVRRWL